MTSLEDKVKWAEREDKNQNPLEFFRQHYNPGTTRSRLSREDFSLYRILSRRGVLDEAIPDFDIEKSYRGKSIERISRFGNDPITYYQQHHAGLTRGQLQKQDPVLYERLRRNGLLENVPVSSRFGNDPVAYYNEHYAGLTRGQLQKQDPSLYQRLWKDGLLESVPTADINEVRKQSSKFGNDPVAYYQQHHAGLTRGQLAKQYPGLYQRLWKDGLLENVPVSIADFGNGPVAYYRVHYAGLTRGQLAKQYPGLYQRLWKDGLLEHVQKKVR